MRLVVSSKRLEPDLLLVVVMVVVDPAVLSPVLVHRFWLHQL